VGGKKMKSGMISKKLLSVLVGTTLILSNVLVSKPLSVKADTSKYPIVVGQVSPEFAQYIKSGSQNIKSNTKAKGRIPLPFKFNNVNTNGLLRAANLPAQYDLRKLNRVTPIRDQGQIGSCWTFGAYASLESWMLTSGKGQQDYSENNMMCHNGFAGSPTGGGNMYMSTAYLSRWDGPVSEADDPYANPADEQHIVVRDGKVPQQHVQDVLFIPGRANYTDNDDIKNAIMQDGAVDSSICYDDKYFNSTTNAFYAYDKPSSSLSSNHEIAIVGWDDNYSKNNFSQTPPGDGAFIMRNSWGSSWGDGGYFYISYYDNFIGTDNAAYIDAQPTNNYDKIYQYDPLGMVDNLGYNNSTAWFSNIFQAQGNENLAATSFYTTQKSAEYQIYVETNYDTNKFSKLTLVKSGTIDMPGYHTVTLDTPVTLNAGKNFAIVVKLVEANETKPIAIEEYLKGYSDNATASLGQSFMSADGQNWTDLMQSQPALKANVCLKAFTKTTVPSAVPVVTSTNPANGATNVDNTKPITVSFNENIKAGSSFNTIKVIDSSSKAVTANCTINANVLTINASLAAGKAYTVTIPQNAVIDTANKTLADAYSFSFSTSSAPITLNVTSTNPVSGATNADNTKPITVSFNENIKAGSKFNTIKVIDSSSKAVTANCTINANVLTINASLAAGKVYTVTIPQNAVIDTANKTLGAAYTFSFTTASTSTILKITSTDPVDGATDVDEYKALTITFNTNIKAGTNFKNIKVEDQWGNVDTSCTISGSTLTINPSLYGSTTYTVTIPMGAVTDMKGNTLVKDYTYSFTTEDSYSNWGY